MRDADRRRAVGVPRGELGWHGLAAIVVAGWLLYTPASACYDSVLIYPVSDAVQGMTSTAQMPQVGATLGEFVLEKLIARGGFAAVFRARQNRLNRNVAIKVLYPNLVESNPEIAQRFLREVELASRLEHPNIVVLHDFGAEEGALWMAMEYVDGETLEKRLRRGPIPPITARKILSQVLSALVVAHDEKVIHRDLKPGNIMLTEVGVERDFVKLLDFGIGKALKATGEVHENITNTDEIGFGTPRYMSPEQLMNANVGPHTDVYAMGLVFYEMLVGEHAVQGDTTYEILVKQASHELQLPAELRKTAIGQLIAKAVAKDWRERYPTAREFYHAVAELDVSEIPADIDFAALRASRASTPTLVSGGHQAIQRARFEEALAEGVQSPEDDDEATTRAPWMAALALGVLVLIVAGAGVGVLIAIVARSDANLERKPAAISDVKANGEGERETIEAAVGAEAPTTGDATNDAGSAEGEPGEPVVEDDSVPTNGGGTDELTFDVEEMDTGIGEADPATENEDEPAKCTVIVNTGVVRAKVVVEGRQRCSRTPCRFTMPRDGRRVRATVSAPGYHSKTIRIDTSRARTNIRTQLVRKI